MSNIDKPNLYNGNFKNQINNSKKEIIIKNLLNINSLSLLLFNIKKIKTIIKIIGNIFLKLLINDFFPSIKPNKVRYVFTLRYFIYIMLIIIWPIL